MYYYSCLWDNNDGIKCRFMHFEYEAPQGFITNFRPIWHLLVQGYFFSSNHSTSLHLCYYYYFFSLYYQLLGSLAEDGDDILAHIYTISISSREDNNKRCLTRRKKSSKKQNCFHYRELVKVLFYFVCTWIHRHETHITPTRRMTRMCTSLHVHISLKYIMMMIHSKCWLHVSTTR